jgi:hypothetical protein
VAVDRLDTQEELVCDLAVGVTGRDQAQHLEFPVAQSVHLHALGGDGSQEPERGECTESLEDGASGLELEGGAVVVVECHARSTDGDPRAGFVVHRVQASPHLCGPPEQGQGQTGILTFQRHQGDGDVGVGTEDRRICFVRQRSKFRGESFGVVDLAGGDMNLDRRREKPCPVHRSVRLGERPVDRRDRDARSPLAQTEQRQSRLWIATEAPSLLVRLLRFRVTTAQPMEVRQPEIRS